MALRARRRQDLRFVGVRTPQRPLRGILTRRLISATLDSCRSNRTMSLTDAWIHQLPERVPGEGWSVLNGQYRGLAGHCDRRRSCATARSRPGGQVSSRCRARPVGLTTVYWTSWSPTLAEGDVVLP
jgi:hypothetical protein